MRSAPLIEAPAEHADVRGHEHGPTAASGEQAFAPSALSLLLGFDWCWSLITLNLLLTLCHVFLFWGVEFAN